MRKLRLKLNVSCKKIVNELKKVFFSLKQTEVPVIMELTSMSLNLALVLLLNH